MPEVSRWRHLVPVLNVSSVADSVDWFAKLGWGQHWMLTERGHEPTFANVGAGHLEIFLCLNGQGGRGRDGGIGGDGQGVWMSIFVDDVDALYEVCQREGLEVIQPPTDEVWGVREMHVRHPDGHTFRMSQNPSHEHEHEHDHDHEHEHEHSAPP